MTLLAAARDLPQNVMPATKPRSGQPPKTSKHTVDVRRDKNYAGISHLMATACLCIRLSDNEVVQDH